MWTGQLDVQVDDLVVGIGYSEPRVAVALETLTRRFPVVGEVPAPMCFGVRPVRVGIRRRELWLVHHGSAIRHRAADLYSAVRFLGHVLGSTAQRPTAEQFALPSRVFTGNGRAVLVDVAAATDIDERSLLRAGIGQVPVLEAILDRDAHLVLAGGDRQGVHGIILVRPEGTAARTIDARRNELAGRIAADRMAWAWTIDRLSDRIVDADADDLVATIIEMIGERR